MNLKVGDSVLYLHRNKKHTGIITDINSERNDSFPYSVHWINDENTYEREDKMQEYRKQYIDTLGK